MSTMVNTVIPLNLNDVSSNVGMWWCSLITALFSSLGVQAYPDTTITLLYHDHAVHPFRRLIYLDDDAICFHLIQFSLNVFNSAEGYMSGSINDRLYIGVNSDSMLTVEAADPLKAVGTSRMA